jgi:hypothetical protein
MKQKDGDPTDSCWLKSQWHLMVCMNGMLRAASSIGLILTQAVVTRQLGSSTPVKPSSNTENCQRSLAENGQEGLFWTLPTGDEGSC